jgi:glycosyltransferase involved in cell wall biosynthesis
MTAGASMRAVLHVTPYYAPAWAYGGVPRAVTHLARTQARRGHRVLVLTTDTLGPSRRAATHRECLDGVHVTRVSNASNALRGRFNLSTPIGLGAAARRLFHEEAIDLVHCHELRTVETLWAAILARRLGVPVVLSPHGTLPHATGRRVAKRLWDRLVGARLLSRIDQVVALTDAEAADVRALWARAGARLDPGQVAIAPNGVDPEEFAALPPRDAARSRWSLGAEPVALSLGRLAARKGVSLLLDAFAHVARRVPDARLLLAGPEDGMGGRVAAQIRQLGLAPHVLTPGLVSGHDRLAALAAADLFVLPAIGEGLPIAALEAMAAGLPVVLTPGCHLAEADRRGAGVVVPAAVDPLAGALAGLLTDPGRRATMGRRARELVHDRYTWSHVVTQLDAIYASVISRRSGAA